MPAAARVQGAPGTPPSKPPNSGGVASSTAGSMLKRSQLVILVFSVQLIAVSQCDKGETAFVSVSSGSTATGVVSRATLAEPTAGALPPPALLGPRLVAPAGAASWWPTSARFSNASGLALDCAARGQPPPTVRWYQLSAAGPEREATADRLRWPAANGSLVFAPFAASDFRPDVHSAAYRCRATNAFGSVAGPVVRVAAVVDQPFEVQVYDEFTIAGNTAVLRCHVPSFVRDYVVVTDWQAKAPTSPSVQSIDTNDGRYSVFPSGELHVRDVRMSDALTNFRCVARHTLTDVVRLSSYGRLIVTDLRVNVPPKLADVRASLVAPAGRDVELPCAAHAFPPPKYAWFKAVGESLSPLPTHRHLLKGGSLVLQKARPADSGKYVCIVSNIVGEERASTTLRVTAGLRVSLVPHLLTVHIGKSAVLNCSVSEDPVESIQWLKDGQVIAEDGRLEFLSSGRILHINSIQRNDGGMYQCLVVSEQGTTAAEGTAQLTLGDSAPVILEAFETRTVSPGDSVTLRCVASGSPPPAVRWSLDDAPIAVSGDASAAAPAAGPIVDSSLATAAAADGAEGNGRRDGHVVVVVGRVNVSHARPEDGGQWRCEATNSAGSASFAARVNVRGPLAIRPMGGDRWAVAGRDVALHCRVIGYPIGAILWKKGNRLLPLHHRQRVFPNGTLIVFSVTPEDAGRYSCHALEPGSPESNVTASLTMTVKVPPLIERFAFDENLYEGMRTRVYCNIARGDQPLAIQWLKNGQPLKSGAQLQVRQLDAFSVALIIDSLNPAHNGNYTCMASNEAAVVNSTAQLLVYVPPHWVREPKDLSAIEGHSIHIDCMATGHPYPRIIWQRGGTERQSSDYKQILSGPDYQIFENGTLRISTVRYGDRGPYLCQAANGVGSGLSTVVQLNVQVPARIEHATHNNTVRLGNKMALNCPVRGDRPIRVGWSKNGQPVSKDSKIFGLHEKSTAHGLISSLIIHKVQRQDSGTYMCSVKNDYGNDEMQIRLYVQEPPEAVEGFNATTVSSRGISVIWQEPYNGNSPITYYLIQHKNSSDVSWESDRVTNLTVAASAGAALAELKGVSWTIRGLSPDQIYHVRILAVNEIGVGPPSINVLRLRTEEEVPAGPPTNVYVQAADPTSLRVSWNPPIPELRNGRIKGYYVGYRLYNSTDLHLYKTVEAKAMKNNGQLGECVLHNLRKFTRYSILVQAYNSIGAGPRSDEVVVSTAEDVPQVAPEAVFCHALSPSSIKLSWNGIDTSHLAGVLRGYHIIYQLIDLFKMGRRESDDVTSTSLIMENLEVYSNYSFRVAAVTGGGLGQLSEPTYCKTHESVPEEPEDMKAFVLAPDAIIVSWRPPKKANGFLQTYTVYCRVKNADSNSNVRRMSVPSSQLYHEVRNLRHGTRYEFWVTASTAVGEGPPSKRALQVPDTKAPARIASFSRAVSAMQKEDLELDCRMAGLPLPHRVWKINERLISSGSPRVTFTGSGGIRIEAVEESDAANYSCHVTNSYGKDRVDYVLAITSDLASALPPKPQDVEIVRTSFNSITLSWLRKNSSATVTSYEVFYSREMGSWLKVTVPTGESGSKRILHELLGLHCGSQYQLYVVALGPSGQSEASHTVTAKTLGDVPRPPKKEHFIVSNSTSLTLRPSSWEDNGCMISHLTVEYRPRTAQSSLNGGLLHPQWIVVSRNLSPDEGPMTLHDLRPETWYSVRVTASNDAGSTDTEFAVKTVSHSHVTPELMVHDQGYDDLALVIPLIVIVLVIAAGVLTSVALLFCCKSNRSGTLGFLKPPGMSVIQRESLTLSPAETALMEAKANQEVTRQLCLGLGSPNRRIVPSANQHTGSMDNLSSFGIYDDLHKPSAQQQKHLGSPQAVPVPSNSRLITPHKPLMVTATLNRHRRRPSHFTKTASNDDILCEKSSTVQGNHYDNPREKHWEQTDGAVSTLGKGGASTEVANPEEADGDNRNTAIDSQTSPFLISEDLRSRECLATLPRGALFRGAPLQALSSRSSQAPLPHTPPYTLERTLSIFDPTSRGAQADHACAREPTQHKASASTFYFEHETQF